MKITVEQLRKVFVGKSVRITHSGNSSLKDDRGTCQDFHQTGASVDIELDGGRRYGFVPEELTSTAVEGNLGRYIAGRRRAEITDEAPVLLKQKVKPSDFYLRGDLCGSKLRNTEKEIVARNIIRDARQKGNQWHDFTFEQYLENRVAGTANGDIWFLDKLVSQDRILDKKGEVYSVNENFFTVLKEFI